MTIVELKCKPFVADFLKKKYGPKIKISAKGSEMAHLRGLMQVGKYDKFRAQFFEKYSSGIQIEFPNLYIWKSGRVGFPFTTIMEFNGFVRDLIADGMNCWIDAVSQTVNTPEADLILNYLKQVAGIEEENINLDTWKRIRGRYKQALNNGPKKKKKTVQFVTEKTSLSFYAKN